MQEAASQISECPAGARLILIPSRGFHAIVDEDDFLRVNAVRWSYVQRGGYPVRWLKGGGKMTMHKMVAGNPPRGMDTDHKNGNPLDNRKSNLRFVRHMDNCRNRRNLNVNNTTGFQGVTWNRGKWTAKITINGARVAIGRFDNIPDAAGAYITAAIEYWGEFAGVFD